MRAAAIRDSPRKISTTTSRWSQRIGEIARRKNCTPGQLALAWLLAQGDDIVPIPGTKQKERLLENIGALAI